MELLGYWPKKSRLQTSKVKTLLIVFLDNKGIIHKEFVPAEQNHERRILPGRFESIVTRYSASSARVAQGWKMDAAPR